MHSDFRSFQSHTFFGLQPRRLRCGCSNGSRCTVPRQNVIGQHFHSFQPKFEPKIQAALDRKDFDPSVRLIEMFLVSFVNLLDQPTVERLSASARRLIKRGYACRPDDELRSRFTAESAANRGVARMESKVRCRHS